ncbi:hypothetical protein Anapl_04624 [Anas platyrhynchos]|uniref:Uncharacterized protein n=1 Tax=Anas platyrhynchos TaxID=8839 RepID=R0LUF2_ANAPL|nr:hypothetical protein Anapl_04624 [Anas platyrhynchos]
MRPDQPCIFFLTLPVLALLLPKPMSYKAQAELQLKEQVIQSHNLGFPGERSFSDDTTHSKFKLHSQAIGVTNRKSKQDADDFLTTPDYFPEHVENLIIIAQKLTIISVGPTSDPVGYRSATELMGPTVFFPQLKKLKQTFYTLFLLPSVIRGGSALGTEIEISHASKEIAESDPANQAVHMHFVMGYAETCGWNKEMLKLTAVNSLEEDLGTSRRTTSVNMAAQKNILNRWQLLSHGVDQKSLIKDPWSSVHSLFLVKEQLCRTRDPFQWSTFANKYLDQTPFVLSCPVQWGQWREEGNSSHLSCAEDAQLRQMYWLFELILAQPKSRLDSVFKENRFRFLNGAKLKKVPSKINNGIEVCHRLLRNPYGTLKEHVKERDEIAVPNTKFCSKQCFPFHLNQAESSFHGCLFILQKEDIFPILRIYSSSSALLEHSPTPGEMTNKSQVNSPYKLQHLSSVENDAQSLNGGALTYLLASWNMCFSLFRAVADEKAFCIPTVAIRPLDSTE